MMTSTAQTRYMKPSPASSFTPLNFVYLIVLTIKKARTKATPRIATGITSWPSLRMW